VRWHQPDPSFESQQVLPRTDAVAPGVEISQRASDTNSGGWGSVQTGQRPMGARIHHDSSGHSTNEFTPLLGSADDDDSGGSGGVDMVHRRTAASGRTYRLQY
jgi:hypothetical protein